MMENRSNLRSGLQNAQTGWAENRRLDRSGWAIVGVYAMLIALVLFLIYRMPEYALTLLGF